MAMEGSASAHSGWCSHFNLVRNAFKASSFDALWRGVRIWFKTLFTSTWPPVERIRDAFG